MQAQGQRPAGGWQRADGNGRGPQGGQFDSAGAGRGQWGGRGASPHPNMRMLPRAIAYIRRYPRIALLAYGSLFIATLAQLMVPQLVQNIIDTVVRVFSANQILALPPQIQAAAAQRLGTSVEQLRADQSNATAALVTAMVAVTGFAALRALFAFGQTFNAERISQNVAFDFRNELFAKIQRLSFSYHDRNQTGQLMVRATDDVEKVRLFIGQGLVLALQALVLLVGTLIVLWFTNTALTLTVLPILPIAFVFFFVFGSVSGPLFMRVQQRVSALNTVLQENVAGLKVVRAFAREPYEETRFTQSANDLLAQQLKVSRTMSFLFPFMFLLANIGQSVILYFGGRQIIEGTLTLGEWQKFSLYLVYVFFPLGQLGFIVSLMAQAAASAQRIFEILDTRNEVEDKPGASVLTNVKGLVTFDDVTFRYFKGAEPVLNHVSLEARPGQTIALLGATGSGKTTIINLIPRFYDVSAGRVQVDNLDVRDVSIESLRANIGIVLQETTLFTGTIRDNIAFGRPDATMEDVVAAAKAAAAHDFIMEFPEGYDTPVGERGSTLSGGQKQRVAIARALLLDPKILILDDSTSSVDVATEYRIQQALTKLMKGRTSFVIAQRISTVVNADQILILDRGQIAARGTHEELLETSELYADIYHSQLMEDVVVEQMEMTPA